MIEYIEGNIFESPAQVIVNTVNTVGVMGKGLALSFKQRYPQMFEKYKQACEKHLLTTGKLMLVYEADHWLLLFPTKENWRNPSKMEYIEKGLRKFVDTYEEKGITSIAFPRLGCGNGELNWDEVKPLMEKYLKKLPIDVYIYLGEIPDNVPEHKESKKTIEWLRQNAKDMSFNGVKDDLSELSALLPYVYEVQGQKYEMKCSDNNLEISALNSQKTWCLSEERFYTIWDMIRTCAVFSEFNAEEDEQAVYGLLYAAGYLSKIHLFDDKEGKMLPGYQINSGLGRVRDFQEA